MPNMKEIPQEIWANIARQLRQPLPPAGQKGVTWKDLHQQDLTSMMRVSKTLHLATATVLYSEIVVDNPASLLKGVERDGFIHTSPFDPEPSAPLHKRHLLPKVRAAHYVYSAADNEPYKPNNSAKKNANRGRVSRALHELSVRYTDLRRRGPETKDQRLYRRLRESCDFDRHLAYTLPAEVSLDDLFPSLAKRTICAWRAAEWWPTEDYSVIRGSPYWDIYQDKCRGPNGVVADFEANLAATVPLPVGRYTCQNSLAGPLSESVPLFIENKTEINVLHRLSTHQQMFVWSPDPQSMIPRSFVPGIENRLDVSLMSNLRPPYGVSLEDTEAITAWAMSMTSTYLSYGLTWFAHHVKEWERSTHKTYSAERNSFFRSTDTVHLSATSLQQSSKSCEI